MKFKGRGKRREGNVCVKEDEERQTKKGLKLSVEVIQMLHNTVNTESLGVGPVRSVCV